MPYNDFIKSQTEEDKEKKDYEKFLKKKEKEYEDKN